MFEHIQRTPDVVMIEEKQAFSAVGNESIFALNDVSIEAVPGAEGLSVFVTAESTPVKKVRLRWHFQSRLRGQVLGDAWERSYADLGWQHITPYFLAAGLGSGWTGRFLSLVRALGTAGGVRYRTDLGKGLERAHIINQ